MRSLLAFLINFIAFFLIVLVKTAPFINLAFCQFLASTISRVTA